MRSFLILIFCSLLSATESIAQNAYNKTALKGDIDEILADLKSNYVYLRTKRTDLTCIREHYYKKADEVTNESQAVSLFEMLLNEFYDSHLILNTNTNSSYRLHAPIYASIQHNRYVITSIRHDIIAGINDPILGAEIIAINDIGIEQAIDEFPTNCHDKKDAVVREWILNKILAGRYDRPRSVRLKLKNKTAAVLDLDKIAFKTTTDLVSSVKVNNIGIITIHNSLGNNDLISAFDQALDRLFDTKALIIDLRNTVDGGNSYVARGIMSRFISKISPYQKHMAPEQYGNGPLVERNWTEFVMPRGKTYTAPVMILVSRWTGSMGEGLAIGFEGMGRATIVGTEMERLAGEMNGFSFHHRKYGYRISTAKLFHVNGTPREQYVPLHYAAPENGKKDATLEKAMGLLKAK